MDVAGFITAGGRSSRMGRDKAWLDIGGRPMVSHVVDALRPVVAELAIIANSKDYQRLGVHVVPDLNTHVGPIEGVRTALATSRYERVILVGCDLPFVTPELFKHLLSRADRHDSVVPLGPNHLPEPLCALYSKRSLHEVERIIESGKFKISPLFDRIDTLFIDFEELSHLPGSEHFFQNVNTPDEYERALALRSPPVTLHKTIW